MAKTPTTFLGQLLARLTSETPLFFKKILIFGISLGTIGGAIIGIHESGVELPKFLIDISSYMVTAGLVCAAVAKSSTTNPDLQAKGGAIPKEAVNAVKEANANNC